MSGKSTASEFARRRRSGRHTRAEILASAERYFAERGFEATRLDDIATEVGIRRAAIFYYFGDKRELYAAVLDEVLADWTAALPTVGSQAERLEAGLTGWIDYIVKRPSVARLILREAASAHPDVVSQFVRAASAPLEWFRAAIEQVVASGRLKPLIEPHRFISLMGAITVFHFFAAMPWRTLGLSVDPWSQDELDKHKREMLLVARTMLGIEQPRLLHTD